MAKVKDTVTNVRPVVEKLAKDEQLRRQLLDAFVAARSAYTDVGEERTARAVATQLASDKAVQRELKKTVKTVRKSAKKARKRSHFKRNTLILSGVVVGLLYNPATGPETRKWIREKVLGADETFEYEGLSTN